MVQITSHLAMVSLISDNVKQPLDDSRCGGLCILHTDKHEVLEQGVKHSSGRVLGVQSCLN